MLLRLVVSFFLFTGGASLDSLLATQECEKDIPSTSNGVMVCTDDSCPPGFFCEDGRCHCGHNPPQVFSCNGTSSSSVLDCYCVTLEEDTNTTEVGPCMFNCGSPTLYDPLPKSIYQLNTACDSLNRTGTLCGRCKQDHYPLAYSFNWTCVQCPHARSNWVWYIMAAYLPLTAFCVAILFFKVNIASSHFYPVIVLCQLMSVPAFARFELSSYSSGRVRNSNADIKYKILLSLFGVWNLDFFRPFYSNLCLGLDILPTLALDYAIAVYPLLLMVITYLLIVLYDKNCRIVTLMWRPFRRVFSLLGRDWNIRTSVIDAFSTFLLLSNLKFLSVSFDILVYTPVFYLHGTYYNVTSGLYYSPDITYFGKEHYPFAVLAIFCLCVFVVLPITLLLVYPLSLFQKLLNLIPVRWFILHTFMDSCQGVYKDGTEAGTRDCRWFSCIYLLVGLIAYILYGITLDMAYLGMAAIIFVVLAFLFLAIQPFKFPRRQYGVVHALFNSLTAIIYISISASCIPGYVSESLRTGYAILAAILSLSPFLYTVLYVLYWSFQRRKGVLNLVLKITGWKKGYIELLESGGEKLADRINNPAAYPNTGISGSPPLRQNVTI